MVPNDPVMLLSFLNMKLRDQYKDLSTLCEDLSLSETEIIERMKGIDYHYNVERNQFV